MLLLERTIIYRVCPYKIDGVEVKNFVKNGQAETNLNKKVAAALRDLDVIFEDQKGIQLVGGSVSKYYVDVKKAYGYPEVLALMADAMWAKIDQNATCIVATGHGGVPLATVIAQKHNLKLVLLEEKSGSLVEYKLPSEQTLERMRNEMEPGVNCIAASGHHALVTATLLSLKYGLKLTMVRDKLKGHGKPTMLDGYVPHQEPVEIMLSETQGEDKLRKMAAVIEKDSEAIVLPKWIAISASDSGFNPFSGRDSQKAVIVDDVLTEGTTKRMMKPYVEASGAALLGGYVVVKRGEADVGFPMICILRVEELSAN